MSAQRAQGLPEPLPRELAEGGDGGSTTPRSFSEQEVYAIAADHVKRETAERDEKITKLESEKAELATKLDTSEAAVQTEKAAREKAEQDLKDATEAHETEKAAAGRKDARVKAVKEKASHLGDDYFTDERVGRWAAMSDEDFENGVLKEIAELTSGLKPAESGKQDGKEGAGAEAPRETAMAGSSAGGSGETATGNARRLFAVGAGGTS